MELFITVLVAFFAGMGAGLGTGFERKNWKATRPE